MYESAEDSKYQAVVQHDGVAFGGKVIFVAFTAFGVWRGPAARYIESDELELHRL